MKKKSTKSKIRDLKPKKDAKGGGQHGHVRYLGGGESDLRGHKYRLGGGASRN
jgi:hypothetical protein